MTTAVRRLMRKRMTLDGRRGVGPLHHERTVNRLTILSLIRENVRNRSMQRFGTLKGSSASASVPFATPEKYWATFLKGWEIAGNFRITGKYRCESDTAPGIVPDR
jgi:hypothetical protein